MLLAHLLSELVIGNCGNKEQTNAAIAGPDVDRVLLKCTIFTNHFKDKTLTKSRCRAARLLPLQLSAGLRRTQFKCDHAKISHLAENLPTTATSRQQVVFALLVSSCEQAWNKLLTTCNNLVDSIRLAARLFQQVRHSRDITILLQPCV